VKKKHSTKPTTKTEREAHAEGRGNSSRSVFKPEERNVLLERLKKKARDRAG